MIVVIPFAFRGVHHPLHPDLGLLRRPSFIKVILGQDPVTVNGEAVHLWRFVLNNLFFLTSIIIVGAFGSFIMDNTRRRELRGRLQLGG
ncbi:MAG: hypothetical protein MZU79_02455 [Anaerotruncus sp.]|nr:hypothetical protein [Anaerotruncus sp.]